jgi:hypothetical protein
MLYLVLKAGLSGVIIAVVSEVARRSPTLGALIVSLPLVSLLGILWLWRDTGDAVRIAAHAESTFWSGMCCRRCRCFSCCRRCCAMASASGQPCSLAAR